LQASSSREFPESKQVPSYKRQHLERRGDFLESLVQTKAKINEFGGGFLETSSKKEKGR